MVAQHAAAHLFHLAGLKLAQLKRAIGHADKPVHRQAHHLHRAADLAVFAFAQANCQPRIGALLAVQRDTHGLKFLAIDFDPLAQRGQAGIVGAAIHTHAVFAQPTGRGQFQLAFQRAIIGQQQQALGIQIQPAHAHHAGHFGGQRVINRGAPLLVAGGCHKACGLVVQPQARRFRRRQRRAIHGDAIPGRHVQRSALDNFAIDGNAACGDQRLGFAAAGAPRPGDNFGDTLACGVRLCAHGAGMPETRGLRKRRSTGITAQCTA